jgi:hypothetical protein
MKTCLAWSVAVLALAMPAAARTWKPTPQQNVIDYTVISHNKGPEGRVIVQWMSSAGMSTPTMQQLLEKYVVITVAHSRTLPTGGTSWDDIQGVTVTDAAGTPLKELTEDTYPPSLVGIFASSDAQLRQSTQGKGKNHWGVYEAGSVAACGKGGLRLTYDGETYTWDTPLPGCPKN